jgi:hypothetical protein
MKTLYEGNLNYKFAWRPTKKELFLLVIRKIVETIVFTIVSVPLALYLLWIIFHN